MNKTRIEWTDYTWNPIKGMCPVGCWYCYARRMYKRLGWERSPRIDTDELVRPMVLFKPSKIFVCSTHELFYHDSNHDYKQMRDLIFQVIEKCPQHTFQILTKMPENIDRPMPDNVWLGVSVDDYKSLNRIYYLLRSSAKIKLISYEPMLDYTAIPGSGIDWVIIGRLTGHGTKHDPPKDWIRSFVEIAHEREYKVFLKNNLKEIWGEPLIQEFPE